MVSMRYGLLSGKAHTATSFVVHEYTVREFIAMMQSIAPIVGSTNVPYYSPCTSILNGQAIDGAMVLHVTLSGNVICVTGYEMNSLTELVRPGMFTRIAKASGIPTRDLCATYEKMMSQQVTVVVLY